MKKVIQPAVETLNIKETHPMHLYAFESNGDIFKLHTLDTGWAFVDLDTSCICTDIYDTLEEAISDQLEAGETVYEFVQLDEFLRWALEKVEEDEMV
jgi:hypothetical protein